MFCIFKIQDKQFKTVNGKLEKKRKKSIRIFMLEHLYFLLEYLYFEAASINNSTNIVVQPGMCNE